MNLEHIIIEVRHNLCCANVFLTFKDPFSAKNRPVNAIIRANEFIIEDEATFRIFVGDFIKVEPKSLNRLLVKGNNISFRISLVNEPSFVNLPPKQTVDHYGRLLKINLDKNEEVQIVCSNCSSEIMKERKSFRRVLPLPLSCFDVNDWFCHKHSDVEFSSLPNNDDLFYGFFNIIINKTNVQNVKTKESFLYCNRCLKLIGQETCKGEASKIWGDVVMTSSADRQIKDIFPYSEPNEKFYFTLSYILSQICLPSELHSINLAKILLISAFPNRKNRYVMANIMENNLEILTKKSTSAKYDQLELEKKVSFKILFKLENDVSNALLNYWREDMNVQSLEVSQETFSNFVRILLANSEVIPEEYRFSNGFTLSYVYK